MTLPETGSQTMASAASPPLDVVMATYDGAAYLNAQLESLRAQSLSPRHVWIRDDGSTDATPLLLRRWVDDWAALQVLDSASGNLGINASFHALIAHVAAQAEPPAMLAFADQDDVWLPEKLALAAEWHADHRALHGEAVPALYCAAATITDERLRVTGSTPIWRRSPALGNALVENIALGCTVVINRAALELLARPLPAGVIAHDWWAYLVVAACGGVVHFDPQPVQFYRQHGANAIGLASSLGVLWRRRLARLVGGNGVPAVFAQAEALLNAYDDCLTPVTRGQILRFIEARDSLAMRLRQLLLPVAGRQRLLDDLAFRLMIAAGRVG